MRIHIINLTLFSLLSGCTVVTNCINAETHKTYTFVGSSKIQCSQIKNNCQNLNNRENCNELGDLIEINEYCKIENNSNIKLHQYDPTLCKPKPTELK